jgi:hypothetical protein
LVGSGDFGTIANVRMAPNGKVVTLVSIAIKSCICL